MSINNHSNKQAIINKYLNNHTNIDFDTYFSSVHIPSVFSDKEIKQNGSKNIIKPSTNKFDFSTSVDEHIEALQINDEGDLILNTQINQLPQEQQEQITLSKYLRVYISTINGCLYLSYPDLYLKKIEAFAGGQGELFIDITQ